MALIQTAAVWLAYAIVVFLIAITAAIYVYEYQDTRERSAFVSTVSIVALTSLLATVLLLPVDIALVSSTSDPHEVLHIIYTLKTVYYTLYSFDTLLCLIVIPFTYFWFEEGDDDELEERQQSAGRRFWGAFKYTLIFVALVVILFLVGFFLPVGRGEKQHMDLDFFRRLLAEGRGERSLTFTLGLLISLGTLIYILYTGAGLALLPIKLIKSAPAISAPELSETTTSLLERNRERQRQLELRNQGRQSGMPNKDRRELESLVREERTLVRRARIAAEARGEGKNIIVRAWQKICAVFRPLKLLGGGLLVILGLAIWVSMLITGIDKATNSICKQNCGYVLSNINVFQPINWIFVQSAKVFPVDYVLMALLVLFFFSSSVVGIATIGIRFLWVRIFEIRIGRSTPQSMLIATVMLTLMMFAINYSIVMIVAPQYSIYGPQKYCDNPANIFNDTALDCSNHPELIKPCTQLPEYSTFDNSSCTPSVVSTFLNRVTVNFPVFGALAFWAQFAFLGVFLIVFVTALFRIPRLDMNQWDADAEADEEEGLLASTGRRWGATWSDITGRFRNRASSGIPNYGDDDE